MANQLSPEAALVRRRRRRLLIALAAGAACTLAVDAFWVEPYSIEVSRHYVHAPLAAPLKIAHLSDLHTYGLGRRERRMLAILEVEKPDLIVITGDTISRYGSYRMCREVLQQLHAPLGVWLVRGNWENWRPLRHEHAYYESAGVHLLLNAGVPVRPDVWLMGLNDPWTGTARPDDALAGAPPGSYVIALLHSPFYFDQLAGRVNLALAGHTHGGQIWLPGLVRLWLPGGCGRFLAGWYEQNGSRMYVSRGLGMSNLPVRFLCRPELAFTTVGP